MSILVTGGLGFIGSTIIKDLLKSYPRENIICLDKKVLETPSTKNKKVTHITQDLTNLSTLKKVFTDRKIKCVFHLAALISIEDGEKNSELYYKNNVLGLENLLKTMTEFGCTNIVFASTAAVYNSYIESNFLEDARVAPESVYGRTKSLGEILIREVYTDLNYVIFRFFNVAGGLDHIDDPKHLIPVIISKIKKGEPIEIYGTDYPTDDGTCVRDYIHVKDISTAFKKCLDLFNSKQKCNYTINLGSNTGYSVKQIIDVCFQLTGKTVSIIEKSKRAKDGATLLAKNELAKQLLDWEPTLNLETIIKDSLY